MSSKIIGDITFIANKETFMTFSKVSNPEEIVRLARYSKEQYFSLNTNEETEKEAGDDGTQTQIPKENNTNATNEKGLVCSKCMNSNPKDSAFCNKCSSKLINACQKCGNINSK
jgi:uncharacterized paraquat-inducible protein A